MACTNFAAEKVSVDASSKNVNEKDELKISAVGWVKESCILLAVVQANWLRKMAYKFKRQAGKLKLHHEHE